MVRHFLNITLPFQSTCPICPLFSLWLTKLTKPPSNHPRAHFLSQVATILCQDTLTSKVHHTTLLATTIWFLLTQLIDLVRQPFNLLLLFLFSLILPCSPTQIMHLLSHPCHHYYHSCYYYIYHNSYYHHSYRHYRHYRHYHYYPPSPLSIHRLQLDLSHFFILLSETTEE